MQAWLYPLYNPNPRARMKLNAATSCLQTAYRSDYRIGPATVCPREVGALGGLNRCGARVALQSAIIMPLQHQAPRLQLPAAAIPPLPQLVHMGGRDSLRILKRDT